MNCKPGDLAVLVGPLVLIPELVGRFVDVVKAPPVGVDFNLPNGIPHVPCPSGNFWVIRFHNPADLTAVRGSPAARYGVCMDANLRPIRDPGENAKDEMLRPLPEEVPA